MKDKRSRQWRKNTEKQILEGKE